jgi:hypothetical protein
MEGRWIDKIEVVRRQLAEAIRLYFEQRDPVVVHTVVASAHQILVDLGRAKGIASLVKNLGGLEGGAAGERLRLLNGPYNFFKHADHDPEGKLFLGPLVEFSTDFIMDACVMLQGVAGEMPIEAKVFWSWYVAQHPTEFPDGGPLGDMKQWPIADWDFPTICKFLKFADLIGDLPLNPDATEGS